MSTSQFTNQQIADYVSAVLGGAGTDAEKAATINAAAAQYGVSRDQIAGATGYGLDVVNQYLGAPAATPPPTPSAATAPTSSAATAPTSSAAPATSPAVSNEDINKYIQGVLSSGVSQQEAANQINAAAQQYDVTRERLAASTGYGLDVVNKYLGALPTTNASPLSTVSADKVLSNQDVTSQSPLSLLSADERQQSAIDSATVKPQDTAGYYRGVQIPTFTDRTVYQGGGEDGIFESAAQQLASWQTEQDRRAALTPEQRAIEDARYDIQGEGGTDTAYNTVIVGGKEYTVAGDGSNLVRISDNQSGLGAKQTRYDMLDPVTGKITQEIGVEGPGLWKSFLTNPITGLMLGLALPGLGSAIGSALGATGAAAGALGSGVLNFGLQVAAGADPIDALKGAVLSAGAGFAGAQVSSMLPTELASAGKNAVTQLITTGKLDPAALATSVGTSFATDALAAETGVDRATAAKLVTAGLQALQGNELAALTSLAQVGIQSGLGGTGATAQSPQDRAAFLEANASPLGLSALSPIAAEDEQIALLQRQNAANQALSDYLGPGNDLSREGLVSQLQSLGLTADQAEGYAQQADQKINMNRVGADVMNRYSKIDPEFGTPQLDRNTAVQEMVAAGFTSDRANEILNGIDAQNAIKLENRLSVQSAYQNFTQGKGSEDQLRSALTSAGYSDAQINELVTRGRGVLEGSKLTSGEQAQERVSQLPDVRAEIAAKPTFSEAYRLARDTYGSGATFTWQGKSYSTATAEERPDLSAAGLAAKAMSGDPQFQVALSEKAVQNQRDISQVFSDYSQKGGDLTREGALSRLEKLGVTKDQASFYLDQADGKLPLLFDQFKSKVPTASEDSYRAYIVAFNELKNKGVPTSLIDVSGYAASGAKPNMPAFINAISTTFGMGAEAAGNALKAFGTVGESLGFNTAQMADYGRKLEKIAQELYPQALTASEDEVKGRFANAKTPKELGQAIVDSVLNNPGAVLKMGGVEIIQEAPNIALALATGGTSALIRYGGMLAGLGLDVVESAGLQGAQKVDEGLAKGLTRAQAVKSAVDDMKAAGAVTAVMTAAADKVPFGGTIAKTMIKGSAGEGIEEYLIARATDQDHMSALRQAAFGALIGGPTEATLKGAGNLTNVTINGDTMIGTYADGTKVSIREPAGATDLKIDIIKPTDTSVNVSNILTADLSSGADLTASINNVVSNNITADLSGTIDSTVRAVIDTGVDLSRGVTDLTSSAVANTGDTTAVINNVVSSLASNGTDLNANAGSIVTGAVSGGASVTKAVDTTLKAVTANGGNVADVTGAVSSAVSTALNNGASASTVVTGAVSSAVSTALNNGANASTVVTGAVSSAVSTALNNGANASTVVTGAVSSAVSTALNNGASASTVVTGAVSSAVTSGLNAGANASTVIASSVTAAVSTATQSGADATAVVTGSTSTAVSTAIASGVDASTAVGSAVTAAIDAGANASVAAASSITAAIAAGTDINTAIAAATNANSNVTANSTTNNNVITTTATDTNTGVTTQTSVNTNTNTTTTTTTNNNVTTQVTTAGSTTTTVTSDVNTGLTTQTTVDTNTNTTTKITVNTNTDEVVVKVTDSSTGEVLDTQIKTVDELTPSEREKLTITDPTTKTPVTKPPVATAPTTSRAASLAGAMALPGMLMGEETPRLGGKMLKSEGDTTIKNPLEAYMERVEEMNRVDPALMAVMAQRLGIQLPEQSQEVKFPTFTYGQETSIDDILGLNETPKEDKEDKEEEKFAYAEGGYVEPLRAKPMNLQFMNRGGALPGGREDFKGGKHVAGDGDGQSDDIPAWLADGEFVFPADVVSALGNGSTKAGTDKLYKMMHEIRARARSTKVKDLPPPAHKSPLDYIKKGK